MFYDFLFLGLGGESDLCEAKRFFRFSFTDWSANYHPMGQQTNKIQKRKRREAYLKRKKEAAAKTKK